MSDSSITAILRETLFGDMPLDQWPKGEDAKGEPWTSFITARQCLSKGENALAVVAWKRITEMPGLESRHYVQAWHFLRQHGEVPNAAIAKQVLGVVLEMPMTEDGFDLLAAYADHTARWIKYTGMAVIWDAPEPATDAPLIALLEAGQEVANRTGPWEDARPGLPPSGHARLNFLTPGGLHFGQGPVDVLSNDPLGGEIIRRGTLLLQAMIKRGGR